MTMKKILFFLASVAFIATACNPEKTPSGGFAVYDATDYELNQLDLSKATDLTIDKKILVGQRIVVVANNNDADFYVVYPGEARNSYYTSTLSDEDLKDTVNNVDKKTTGYALTKASNGVYRYEFSGYTTAGDLTMVFISRNAYKQGLNNTEKIDSVKFSLYDANTNLFDESSSSYEFLVVRPKNSTVSYDGNASVTITVPADADLSNAQFKMLAGNATLDMNNKGAIKFEKRFWWWDGSLSTAEPLKLTVTSLSGESKEYTINIQKQPASAEKELLTLSANSSAAAISGTNVTVELPAETTDLTDVKIDFTLSAHAKVIVGTDEIKSGNNIDLSSPVTLKIEAQDGSSTNYTLSATTKTSELLTIKLTSLNPVIEGVISPSKIEFTVHPSTELSKVIPSFEISNSSAKLFIGNTELISGESEIDLSGTGEITIDLKIGDHIVESFDVIR